MTESIKHCNYCIEKDVSAGIIDEIELYEEIAQIDLEKYLTADPHYDNHGIFVFFACVKCYEEQKAKYDPIIFDDYNAYERKVADYGERFDD